jgi:two-component system nitrogen regulation response regulator GlnG
MLDSMPDPAPRIMAANQSGLAEQTEKGLFRDDLFYRLSGVTLSVPPLRERVEDIELLAAYFLSRFDRSGGRAKVFSDQAMNLLRSYSWPGNVRQFEHAIKRLVVTITEDQITELQVDTMLRNQPAATTTLRAGEGEKLSASVLKHLRRYFDLHGSELPPDGLYGRILREVEMPLIEIALDATGGNQAKCADLLGINRNTLRKKITDLDIEVTRRRKLM